MCNADNCTQVLVHVFSIRFYVSRDPNLPRGAQRYKTQTSQPERAPARCTSHLTGLRAVSVPQNVFVSHVGECSRQPPERLLCAHP